MQKVRTNTKNTDEFEVFEKKSKKRSDNENRGRSQRGMRGEARMNSNKKSDWRQFFRHDDIQLHGEEPDFSEEGWARRHPKKK